jgi:8-oxo-dGTP pyrophosphatase MutT (NUDIX family)
MPHYFVKLMYQIFVGNKPIILTTIVEEETNFKNIQLKNAVIRNVIRILNKKDIDHVRLIGKKEHKILNQFLKLLPNVVAAGGKVLNSEGKILFIKRNGKWDLPKGKAEKKERIEETAIREVEEETGVKKLRIVKPLDMTYHIFKRNGRYRIKITYWFEMLTDYNGKLIPETSEGITKVKWLGKKKAQKALMNSYANIRGLI